MTFFYAVLCLSNHEVLEQLDKMLEGNHSSISPSRNSHFMIIVKGGHVLHWTMYNYMSFCDLHLTVHKQTFQLFEQFGKFMVKKDMFLRFNFDLRWKKKSMNLETTINTNQWGYLIGVKL